MRHFKPIGAIAALLLGLAGPAFAADAQPVLSGDYRIHDPSVIDLGAGFVAFQTGKENDLHHGAIRLKTSPDGLAWADAGAIGKGLPKWVKTTLGYQPPNIWAPSVSRHGSRLNLYYSVSSFGINTSAIGLMSNDDFDAGKPGEGWQDQGLVLASTARSNFNAIDPFRIDTTDGRAFLSFGSFWSGIKLRELDPDTGLLLAPDTRTYALANRSGAGIEASSIIEHDGKFVLFASFDQCCKGIASTYSIHYGRADRIEGPYIDHEGTPMSQGGGSLLLGSTGKVIGPGGQEAIHTAAGDLLAYHYYDGDDRGVAKLQLSPLRWTSDGWPFLDPLPN